VAQDQFRRLIEHLHEPVILYDSECRRTYLNPAAEKLIGESAASLLGKTASSLRPSSAALHEYQEKIRHVIASGNAIEFDFFLDRLPEGPNVHNKVLRIHAVPEFDAANKVIAVLAIAHDITALKVSEHQLMMLIDNLPDHISRFDRQGRHSYVSASSNALLGLPESYFMGKSILDCDLLGTPEQREKIHQAILTTLQQGQACTIENAWQKDRTAELRLVPEKDEAGEIVGVLGIMRDITEQKLAEAALLKLNRSLRLLSHCNQTLIHAEDENQLLSDICHLIVNSGGYGLAWVGFVIPESDAALTLVASASQNASRKTSLLIEQDMHAPSLSATAISTGQVEINQDYRSNANLASMGKAAIQLDFNSSIALPLKIDNQILGALTIYAPQVQAFSPDEVALLHELASDLAFGIRSLRIRAEHKAAEEKLAYLAHHDPLTGLPNRLLLRDRFNQAVAGAKRKKQLIAMLFLDMDRFKEINDSFGHAIGDALLIKIVQRFQQKLRATDTMSREGGDEFVLLLDGVQDVEAIASTAQQILAMMEEAFEINGNTLHTSFSIGISIYPDDGKDFETLRKNADAALYLAKDNGRNNYRFFASQMNTDAKKRMRVQTDLHVALKNNEFLLHYQPQIRLADGQISGVEALIRWQHPQGALVPPGQFIPIAEQSGLIIPIGTWILYEACRQCALWRQNGLDHLTVSVNLSALQFRRGNIIETVQSALQQYQLPPESLELELTESILLQDTESAINTLRTLKNLGIKLSIDDFGTGYSSLSYLKRLAVDKLKIDQSFIRDLSTDADSAAIARAIIQLGQTLQVEVIAEGVETEQQLAFLEDCGCNEVQGYLFSRPVAAAHIPKIISTL
jgi:diguanylate cyclase (GGDEF)-like protein/PAS domain S-box-containing protein